jgi:hypothetical protein
MPGCEWRFAFADWQHGKDGDPAHFWLLIQDFSARGDSLIVYEGRIDTEGELVAVLKDHNVKPICTIVDTSWDTTNMYNLCLRRGFNGVKAEDKNYWDHEDGTQRFYSETRSLFTIANALPSQLDDPSLEPDFWLYSKMVAMERLVFLRQSKEVTYEIPSDVSEDFLTQFDSWSYEVVRKKDGQIEMRWKPKRDDDHLWQCAAGILPLADLVGVFNGIGTPPPLPVTETESEVVAA